MTNSTQNRVVWPLAAVIAITFSVAALWLSYSRTPGRLGQDAPERNRASLYERVLRNGVLRVGYTVYPPGVMKGPDGKPLGIAVEVLNEACARLNLKVDWGEEVGWATQIEGIDAERYDIIGTAVWPNPKRARLTTLSKPLL